MKQTKLMLVALLALAGLVQANDSPTILWVTDDAGPNFDQPWIDLLTAEGYTIAASAERYIGIQNLRRR